MAWNDTKNPGDLIMSSDWNAQVAWLEQRHRNFYSGTPVDFSITQDNNGAERFFFKDDFSNNTIANYSLTGTPTISSGVLTLNYGDRAVKLLQTTATTGKWSAVFSYDTSYVATTQYFIFYFGYATGANSYLRMTRGAANAMSFALYVNGVSIGSDNFGVSLADSTPAHVSLRYDGSTYTISLNGVDFGTTYAGESTSEPAIGGCPSHVDPLDITIYEWTYSPSIANAETFTVDDETRYMQLASTDLSTWAAAAAGDVVVDTVNHKMTLASNDDRGLMAVFKSYNFGSGEYEFAFDNANDGGGGSDNCGCVFGYQDINNTYRLYVTDNTSGTETLRLAKVVAGSQTTILDADVSASYTRGNKTWIKIHWDAERGQMWAYLRDDAGTYPTTPDISDAFSSEFRYGKFGYQATVTTAGAGNLNVDFFPWTVRAKLLIGETNIPATEANFYDNDEFTIDSRGKYFSGGSGTLTIGIAGGKVVVTNPSTSAHRYLGYRAPYMVSDIDISTDAESSAGSSNAAYVSIGDQGTTTGYPMNGFAVRLGFSGSDNFAILKYVGGTGTTIATTTVSVSTSTPYEIRLVYDSSTGGIDTYFDGAPTPTLSTTDTTFLDTRMYPIIYGKPYDASSTVSFDNLVVSGTRYYMKPMLFGAQVGEYYDGTSEVTATRFTDGFNYDTSAEYTLVSGAGATWDTNYGAVYGASGYYLLNSVQFTDGTIKTKQKLADGTGVAYISIFRWGGTFGSSYPAYCYYLGIIPNTGVLYLQRTGNGSSTSTVATTTVTGYSNTIPHTYMILAEGSSIKVYVDDVLWITTTDSTYTSGYVGFRSTTTNYFYELQINALSSQTTDGTAITLGGVCHGARYDTQEEGYYTFTNSAEHGEYSLTTCGCTTYPSQTYQLYFANTTDSTSISADGSTTEDIALTSTSFTDFARTCVIRHRDKDDTIKVSARRYTYSGVSTDNQPAIFVSRNALVPIWEV